MEIMCGVETVELLNENYLAYYNHVQLVDIGEM